jgi:hypothetical protein
MDGFCVTNIIADYVGTDFPSYGYVLTLTRGFNDKWICRKSRGLKVIL